MAVKNSLSKEYRMNYKSVMDTLRNPKFAALIEAELLEEAKTATYVEFRYTRKTSIAHNRYGRNFFIKVPQVDGNTTAVTITTQSRKVTVLLDTVWQSEVKRVFTALEAMLPL